MEKYEMIMCIVNAGYSASVMDAAQEAGAGGGTVIHARGTANKEAEEFYKITIHPDKDIVLLLVPARIKDKVLSALYKGVGLNTAGQGIAFSVSVNDVVGLREVASGEKPSVKKRSKSEISDTKDDSKADSE